MGLKITRLCKIKMILFFENLIQWNMILAPNPNQNQSSKNQFKSKSLIVVTKTWFKSKWKIQNNLNSNKNIFPIFKNFHFKSKTFFHIKIIANHNQHDFAQPWNNTWMFFSVQEFLFFYAGFWYTDVFLYKRTRTFLCFFRHKMWLYNSQGLCLYIRGFVFVRISFMQEGIRDFGCV